MRIWEQLTGCRNIPMARIDDVVRFYELLGTLERSLGGKREVVKGLAQREVRQQLISLDLEPVGNSQEEMKRYLQSELVKWAKVVRDAKLDRGKML